MRSIAAALCESSLSESKSPKSWGTRSPCSAGGSCPARRTSSQPPAAFGRTAPPFALRAPQDFKLAARLLANPDRRLPRASTVRPDETQLRISSDYLGYDRLGAAPVLNVRGVNGLVKQQPLGVCEGGDRSGQPQRMRGWAALAWALGLSPRSASRPLAALGVSVSRMSVWRDVQEAEGICVPRNRPKIPNRFWDGCHFPQAPAAGIYRANVRRMPPFSRRASSRVLATARAKTFTRFRTAFRSPDRSSAATRRRLPTRRTAYSPASASPLA